MKLYLILALCLSLGFCDKLDRTYLPPEGSHQSSGDPGELQLPYGDNESKEVEVGFQQTQVPDHTEIENIPQQQKINSKDMNYYGFQNRPNERVKFDNEKQISANDFDNNQRNFQNSNNIPFGSPKMPLYRPNFIANIDMNGKDGPKELNPYLPLRKHENPGSISQFDAINTSDKLKLFNNNDKKNFEKIIKLPNNVNNFDIQNMMSYEDSSRNISANPADTFGRKSEAKITDSNFNGNKFPQQENFAISDSDVSNLEQPRFQTTAAVHKNNGSPEKDYKTLQNRPSRPQAQSDRNAEIISYENFISPEDGKFAFSFDTSNGIHVDEHGTSNDGVKAEGGYSYTGDDGKEYTIRYTADENGFQPIGDHLPTPPPIPQAILRVIELAMKNKEIGIPEDNGMYDDNKYGYQNYDHSFATKSKKTHEKPLEKANYKPVPDRGQTVAKTQVNVIGNKESELKKIGIETMKSIDAPENNEFSKTINRLHIPNVNHENNRQTSTGDIPKKPTFSRNIVQTPPLFAQTALDSDIVTKAENNRIPLTENSKITSERKSEKSDHGEAQTPFLVNSNLQKTYDLNPSIKVQPHLSFVINDNFNKKQNQFKTNDPGLLNLRENYQNNGYNAPKQQNSVKIVNPNQNIYQNNPSNVIKDQYDTEPMADYQYQAPTRTFLMSPDVSNLNTNFHQEAEIPDSKPQSRYMLQAAENRRPINNGNNSPEEAVIRSEASKKLASKQYIIPSAYENQNSKKAENIQTLPVNEESTEIVKTYETKSDKMKSEKTPNKVANAVHDNVNFQQSNIAGDNSEIPGGQDFSVPPQKSYFDPKTGYYY